MPAYEAGPRAPHPAPPSARLRKTPLVRAGRKEYKQRRNDKSIVLGDYFVRMDSVVWDRVCQRERESAAGLFIVMFGLNSADLGQAAGRSVAKRDGKAALLIGFQAAADVSV